ncbi:MAG: hypothetical protein K2X27_25725 [Candidatus Obscuribacterales bacterium]|nr:hypothetical protein [Candidatus Obscuribacterales bacterium]
MCTANRILAVRLPMMPRDTSELGNISGGVILSQIDLAAAIVSRRACSNMRIDRMVTRAMNEVEFTSPVQVGDVLCCYGSVQRIGNTSVTVLVEVEVDRNGEMIPVTQATAVFVALDKDGKPTPLCNDKTPPRKSRPKASKAKTPPKPDQVTAAPNPERIVALKKVMMPNETNGMGNIFGGLLMTYMDWAGSYVARRSCKNKVIARCVTRFMDKIEFKEPVHVNDVITCYGSVTKIGTTSVSVHVEVEADRGGQTIPVTQAELVFVAVNARGKKVAVSCAARSGKSKTRSGKSQKKAGCDCKR